MQKPTTHSAIVPGSEFFLQYNTILYRYLYCAPTIHLGTLCFDFTTIRDDYWFASGSTAASHRFNLFDNIHSGLNFSKNHVFAIQPRCFDSCQEKLRSICVFSSIGTGKKTGDRVFNVSILPFIIKFRSINALYRI